MGSGYRAGRAPSLLVKRALAPRSRALVGARRVERGAFRAPGSLRSPMLSGRALRALSANATPIRKTLHPNALPKGAPPARRPESEPQASTRRAREGGAAAAQRPD